MGILNTHRLAAMADQSAEFLSRSPFPFAGLQGVIDDSAFEQLCVELPAQRLFQQEFGKRRAHAQKSHDRYALQYNARLDSELSQTWRAFIRELQDMPYQDFWRRTFGLNPRERFVLSMHWHHAPSGASVSPHTDARRKIGSHIFYFNTPQDWDPAWGGQTVMLDDGGKYPAHSVPPEGALKPVAESEILGNRSFIFKRTEHSWHAVNPVACPPDRLRKVFIVVANYVNAQVLWRRLRGKDPDGYPL